MIIGILGGTLVLASAAILIGGAFTSTSFSVIGWPGSDDEVEPIPSDLDSLTGEPVQPSGTQSVRPSMSPTPRRTPSTTPSPSRTVTPTPKASASASASTSKSPTSSASPSETPTASDPSATDDSRTPPGQTKEPPGLDPDKTHGPKQ